MDNRYYKYGCPALMQDGRFITNYMESRIYEQMIRNANNINSVHDYRYLLQNNGDAILDKERAFIEKKYTCNIDGKCVPLSCETEQKQCGCNCYKKQ